MADTTNHRSVRLLDPGELSTESRDAYSGWLRADLSRAEVLGANGHRGWQFLAEASGLLLNAQVGSLSPTEVLRRWLEPCESVTEQEAAFFATGTADLLLRAVLSASPSLATDVQRFRSGLFSQVDPDPSDPLADAAVHLLNGSFSECLRSAEQAAEQAKGTGDRSGLLDAIGLGALALIELGELARATERARLGSRMARTEEVLQREYFANIVLSRARRYSGRVHLASRICAALETVVPAPWLPWVTHEWSMCGTSRILERSHAHPLMALPTELSRQPVEPERLLALTRENPLPLMFSREVSEFVFAVVPDSECEQPPVADFRRGRAHTVAPGLAGLFESAEGAGTDAVGAYVLLRPGAVGRRFTCLGLSMLTSDVTVLDAGDVKRQRTFQLLSILALSDGGTTSDGELFQTLYGFSYVAEKHSGTFRTQVYRARQLIEGYGTLTRDSGELTLVVSSPVAIPDSRCQLDLDEIVLRSVAKQGTKVSAQEIAEGVGVPLRTVQRALHGLVQDGSCESEKVGRNIHYRVEDTTFYEPSITRLKGASPQEPS